MVLETDPAVQRHRLFSTMRVSVAKMVVFATKKGVATTETSVSVMLMSALYIKRTVAVSKTIVSGPVITMSVAEIACSEPVITVTAVVMIIRALLPTVSASLLTNHRLHACHQNGGPPHAADVEWVAVGL